MSRPLLIFGEDWGRHPSSTQHLAAQFARDRAILWVNSIGMRRPRLNRADLGRLLSKLAAMLSSPEAERPAVVPPQQMSIVAPRALCWPGSRLAAAVNRHLLGGQIRAALRERAIDKPILWTSLPTALPLLGACDESAVVYYCGDDFGALAGVDHAPVREMEAALVARADLVLAASPALAARFPQDKTVLLPHGVDLSLFQSLQPRPADLPQAPRIAGFYGSLSDWLDRDMLLRAARARQDWHFVLIGEQRCDISMLRGLPNVHFLGEKPHHALPAYTQHWQVSLLPFVDNPQIRACNPLKLREYLAVGTPIVSTDFPALAPYRDLVQVLPAGGDLGPALDAALGDMARNEARRRRVDSESWTARAAAVDALLEAL